MIAPYTILISIQDENGTEVFIKVIDCQVSDLVKDGDATPDLDAVLAAINQKWTV